MQNAAPNGSGAVLLGDERAPSIKTNPTPQPDSVHQLRALRLISTHNVRPELALTLAALAFGGAV